MTANASRTTTRAKEEYERLRGLTQDQRKRVAALVEFGPSDRLDRAQALLADCEAMLRRASHALDAERRS